MAQDSRTRFAWTWAGVLAGVVLGGASLGSLRQPARGALAQGAPVEEPLRLAQVDPNAPGGGTTPVPGTQPTPGVTPTPGTTPGTTPFVTGSDAGVGGSGTAPPSTSYVDRDAGFGTRSTPTPDSGVGTPSIPTPGTGVGTPSTPGTGVGGSGGVPPVGGMDGGTGF